jgi:citrate/tricarballylate utilization protein
MQLSELLRQGEHTMTVCNSCRYCEQYCPVFPAMERRVTFKGSELSYLANLCHNCGECLYACQYAPPHEFGIDVPRTLAEIRLASYQHYCWPRPLGVAFERQGLLTACVLALLLSGIMFTSAWVFNPNSLSQPHVGGNFYSVISHRVMVGLFGGVSLFVLLAIAVGIRRFWRDVQAPRERPNGAGIVAALRDALTLKHLHSSGADCTTGEEVRTPWRRIFHHCTFYGFMLCFASTSVAAIYHSLFRWHAPYPYLSLPVVLGSLGGLGLLVGPVGLFWLRRTRDDAMKDPKQQGLDESFIAMLFLTSLTGLLLLMLRDGPMMAMLLIIHLGVVLALFLTLPYSKFMHGFYRVAALVKYSTERDNTADQKPKKSE